jgi:hypothetical protein
MCSHSRGPHNPPPSAQCLSRGGRASSLRSRGCTRTWWRERGRAALTYRSLCCSCRRASREQHENLRQQQPHLVRPARVTAREHILAQVAVHVLAHPGRRRASGPHGRGAGPRALDTPRRPRTRAPRFQRPQRVPRTPWRDSPVRKRGRGAREREQQHRRDSHGHRVCAGVCPGLRCGTPQRAARRRSRGPASAPPDTRHRRSTRAAAPSPGAETTAPPAFA